MLAEPHFTATLRYLKNDRLYDEEKPFGFKEPNEHGPSTNIKVEYVPGVPVKDIRGNLESFNIEKNGFAILHLENELAYEDYDDPTKLQQYFRELERLLKDHLGASRVGVFRHAIRKRHKDWPVSLETSYDYDQPTTVVHIDATVAGCVQEMQKKDGDDAADNVRNGRRFQWFKEFGWTYMLEQVPGTVDECKSFWKPLRTPPAGLSDWPLFFCDSASVDKSKDLMEADLVYQTYATENTLLFHRPEHRWHYLSRQGTGEVIVFKQADSLNTSCSGVAHCSGENPFTPQDEHPRESIEVRALVFYDEA